MDHADRAVALTLVAMLVVAPVATSIAAQSATATTGDTDPVVKVAYVSDGTGNLTLATASGDTIDMGVSAEVVGRAADMDDDYRAEVPYVQSNGALYVIDRTGEKKKLASNAKTEPTGSSGSVAKIAVGDRNGDRTRAVFFASDSGSLQKVTYNGTPETVGTGYSAQSVSGVADVTGDGTAEVVFVQNEAFHYYNTSGVIEKSFGPNQPGEIAAPRDFNHNGIARVLYVSGNNDLQLAYMNGTRTTLTGGAQKAPVAAVNWTGDETLEALYFGSSSENTVKYATLSGSTGTVRTDVAEKPGIAWVQNIDEPLGFSNFSVSNESDSLRVSFDATEDLESVSVNVLGPDATDLTLSDFDEESSGGDYTYVANYTPTADGTYEGTLDSGEAVDGDTASPGYEDSATIDRTFDVMDLNATAAPGQDLNVSFEATDALESLTLTVGGAENATLGLDDFSTSDSSAPYVYNGTYDGSSDGSYTVTFDSASAPEGTDDENLTENVTVDQTGVAVENATLADATNADGLVNASGSVTITANVTGDVGSVTADASAFGAGTVALDHAGGDTYRATVAVDADDTSGNESVTVTARDGQDAVDTDTSDDLLLDAADPTVVLGENRTVEVGESVTFAPETARDDASGVADYTWNLGPAVSDNRTTTYAYEDAGTYTARLAVTDDAGNTETATLTVNVTADTATTTTTEPDSPATNPTDPTTDTTTTPDGTTTSDTTTTSTPTTTTLTTTTTNTTTTNSTTPTTTAASTTEPDPPATSTESAASVPGFGVVVSVIALLAVALLARRDE
ncbi:PKD domain-containing protein [Salarchaeum sp. III]|uniref:PKD domain-containing protein n=1 Tax=Salarchaeum sp. III TaxID=3107927 RepID=UPI002EDABDAB